MSFCLPLVVLNLETMDRILGTKSMASSPIFTSLTLMAVIHLDILY